MEVLYELLVEFDNLKDDPLDVVIGFLNSCQESVVITTSETPSKRKRNISKKHSKIMDKKFKNSSSAWRTLDTFAEEPRVVVASPSAGTVLSKYVPSETHLHFVNKNSSFPYTTLISPTPNPHTSEQFHFLQLISETFPA